MVPIFRFRFRGLIRFRIGEPVLYFGLHGDVCSAEARVKEPAEFLCRIGVSGRVIRFMS